MTPPPRSARRSAASWQSSAVPVKLTLNSRSSRAASLASASWAPKRPAVITRVSKRSRAASAASRAATKPPGSPRSSGPDRTGARAPRASRSRAVRASPSASRPRRYSASARSAMRRASALPMPRVAPTNAAFIYPLASIVERSPRLRLRLPLRAAARPPRSAREAPPYPLASPSAAARQSSWVSEEAHRHGGAEAPGGIPAVAERLPLGQARRHAGEVLRAGDGILGEVDAAARRHHGGVELMYQGRGGRAPVGQVQRQRDPLERERERRGARRPAILDHGEEGRRSRVREALEQLARRGPSHCPGHHALILEKAAPAVETIPVAERVQRVEEGLVGDEMGPRPNSPGAAPARLEPVVQPVEG